MLTNNLCTPLTKLINSPKPEKPWRRGFGGNHPNRPPSHLAPPDVMYNELIISWSRLRKNNRFKAPSHTMIYETPGKRSLLRRHDCCQAKTRWLCQQNTRKLHFLPLQSSHYAVPSISSNSVAHPLIVMQSLSPHINLKMIAMLDTKMGSANHWEITIESRG